MSWLDWLGGAANAIVVATALIAVLSYLGLRIKRYVEWRRQKAAEERQIEEDYERIVRQKDSN